MVQVPPPRRELGARASSERSPPLFFRGQQLFFFRRHLESCFRVTSDRANLPMAASSQSGAARLALLALASAKKCPIGIKWVEHPSISAPTNVSSDFIEPEAGKNAGREYPLLFVTHKGRTLEKIKFQGSRLLVGRSAHNDITVESKFISRHHMLLVRNGESTLLMDLNSANGTYVNSWRVSNQILQNQDVITIGEHGLKFVHVGAQDREILEATQFDDMVVMKSMADIRRVLARESSELVPAPKRPSELPRDP